jgi:hypothetical protein
MLIATAGGPKSDRASAILGSYQDFMRPSASTGVCAGLWFEKAAAFRRPDDHISGDTMVEALVPIAFFAMITAVIVAPFYYRYRERGRLHDTLRLAYERGQPAPPELISALQASTAPRAPSTPERDLRMGVILISVGLSMCGLGYGLWFGFMSVNDVAAYIIGGSTAGLGSVPGLIGLAYLLLWVTRRKSTGPSA